jgi:ribonuclease III
VLGLVVAEMLYRTFGKEDEGAMAKRLAALVRQEGLAHVARSIDLGSHLILSRGEAEGGGRDNAATLADACEAVIGAIYLDAGLDAARQFVERHWAELVAADSKPPQDAKTALQEWAQAAGLPLPIYQVVESSGPPHDPTFTVEVRVSGKRTATASGKSKRSAEQAAAASLMADLRS